MTDTPNPPQALDAGKLTKALRASAQAFREYPIYTMDDDDPVLLTVQADEADQAAATIEALQARIGALEAGVRDATTSAWDLAVRDAPTNGSWEQYARSRLKWLSTRLHALLPVDGGERG